MLQLRLRRNLQRLEAGVFIAIDSRVKRTNKSRAIMERAGSQKERRRKGIATGVTAIEAS